MALMPGCTVDDAVRKIIGTFAVDGMILDNDTIDRLHRTLRGEISHDEAMQEIFKKHNIQPSVS